MNGDTLTIASPDGVHAAELSGLEEVRMGSPRFGTLAVDGRSLADRSFGETLVWSPDSRWLAVTELMDTRRGPVTRVVVVEVETARELSSTLATGGFAEPRSFEGAVLVYTRTFHGLSGPPTVEERELRFPASA